MCISLPGSGLRKGSRSPLTVLSFIGVAILILLFISRYTRRNSADYYSFARKRDALKNGLYDIRAKRSILERRVRDHFLFFCLQGCISTNVAQPCLSHANYNASLTSDGYTYFMICRYVFVLTTCIMLISAVLKFCSESDALSAVSEKNMDAFFCTSVVLFFAAAVNGFISIAFIQKEPVSLSKKSLSKLSNTLEKESKQYSRIARSVAVYNSLSDQAKYDIRLSEHFSIVAREKILSGSLTDECADKMVREIESENCNNERAALC